MKSNKVVVYAFQRDGHTDSVKVSRNEQDCGRIRFDAGVWTFRANGPPGPDSSADTVTGSLPAQGLPRKGALQALQAAEGQVFQTLAEAVEAVVSADPRAGPVNAKSTANRLLPNFRKYTRHTDAK